MKERDIAKSDTWPKSMISPGATRRGYIDPKAYNALRRWCLKSPTKEVGGLMAGRNNHIMVVTKIENIDPKPTDVLAWRASDLKKSRRHVQDGLGLDVIGQWHSHPYGWLATPSKADIEVHSRYELIWNCTYNYPRLWLLRGTRVEIFENEHKLYITRPLS